MAGLSQALAKRKRDPGAELRAAQQRATAKAQANTKAFKNTLEWRRKNPRGSERFGDFLKNKPKG